MNYKKTAKVQFGADSWFQKILETIGKEYHVANIHELSEQELKKLTLEKEIGHLANYGNQKIMPRKMKVEIADIKIGQSISLITYADVPRYSTYQVEKISDTHSQFTYFEKFEGNILQYAIYQLTQLFFKNVLTARFQQVIDGLSEV